MFKNNFKTNIILFLVICILYFFLSYAISKFFYTTEILNNSLRFLNLKNGTSYFEISKFKFLNFIFIPFQLIVKIIFVYLCLKIGLLLNQKSARNVDILKSILLSEFVYIIEGIMRMYLISKNKFSSIQEINSFSPFSIYYIFNFNSTHPYIYIPLSIISIFKLIYIFILSYFLSKIVNLKLNYSIIFVFKTYGLGLLFWIIILTYIAISVINK